MQNCNWWKLQRGKSAFAKLVHPTTSSTDTAVERNSTGDAAPPSAEEVQTLTHELLVLMGDRERAPDHHLPDTGVGVEKEKGLSSICVHLDPPDDGYSTRSSTVLLIDHQNNVHLCERSFHWQSTAVDEVIHHMKLKSTS